MKLTHALRRLHFHTVDGIFQPLIIHGSKDGFAKDGNISCTSQKLMVSQGLIHQSQNGLFCLLPLGLRVVEKLIKIVDSYMEKLGAQKIMVPSLTDGNLWKKTGRLETAGQEIFKVLDRHEKMFVLAPTHEESLANLLATVPALSHRNLPLRLYQITNKYRDEMRPRYGLIRSKEFMMKDLYSFDASIELANNTYNQVCEIYGQLLDHIGISYSRGR